MDLPDTRSNQLLLHSPAELAAAEFELVVRRLAEDLTYGADPSRFVGSGTEYAQTRLFSPGDPVRAIDWRVTARTGKVHVKDYQATKRVPIFIVVDTSASMATSSTPLSKHDAAIWIASVLALVGLNRRSPVAIVAAGTGERTQSAENSLHPTLSRGGLWRSIHALRAPGWSEHTALTPALKRIEALTKVSSAVIVVSDLHDPAALPALKRIAQRHDCLAAQLVDPAERGGLRAGFVRAREAETGRSFTATGRTSFFDGSTRDLHADLIGAGVDHAVIATDQPLLNSLRELLDSHAGTAGGGMGRNSR